VVDRLGSSAGLYFMPSWCGSFPAEVPFSLLAAICASDAAPTLASTTGTGRS